MPQVDPAEWSEYERSKLRDLFGISTMHEPIKGLQDAANLHIPHVELRCTSVFPAETAAAVDVWRKSGGRTLSMHLANLDSNDSPFLAESVDKAIKLGCDRVTLHVPEVTAAKFPEEQEKLLANFDKSVAVLLEHDISIGIENLHTTDGKRTFETRNFGCCIKECRQWITLLREKYQTEKIGFHCDIGHARNNAPISAVENLSDYYCELGDLINGWHFHQVEQQSCGSFKNHREMTGFFTKLISLGGFLMAYRIGQFGDAPIFLEVTAPNGGLNSYRTMMKILGGTGCEN
jgi:sugar phosphate isomerase/epimerase